MIETGEWGEFFPISLSPFGYNEAIASDFYPKEKAEASKLGAKWQDSDYSLKYGGSFYEPENGISAYRESEEKRKQVLGGVLKCSVSGKLFKVTPQELALYLKLGLPIPRQHYEIKFAEELKQINKIKFYQFYHRKCMNGGCPNEFETTYAPDRPERVFCESCYLQNVL
jgi:hypothetical protein